MQASDYPVTFGYGATDGVYYGPQAQGKSTYLGPYHRGDDRAMPVGTPVIVNGVQIGLSGNGNGRYGAHLHVGKFVGGRDVNPNGGGFSLDGARVITVVSNYYSDPVNAKYVRIQDNSGAQWIYLHMSQVNVSVGQVLQGEGEDMVENNDAYWGRWNRLHRQIIGPDADKSVFDNRVVGKSWVEATDILSNAPSADVNTAMSDLGRQVTREQWLQNILDLRHDNQELFDKLKTGGVIDPAKIENAIKETREALEAAEALKNKE